jgi:hypothetical protein
LDDRAEGFVVLSVAIRNMLNWQPVQMDLIADIKGRPYGED